MYRNSALVFVFHNIKDEMCFNFRGDEFFEQARDKEYLSVYLRNNRFKHSLHEKSRAPVHSDSQRIPGPPLHSFFQDSSTSGIETTIHRRGCDFGSLEQQIGGCETPMQHYYRSRLQGGGAMREMYATSLATGFYRRFEKLFSKHHILNVKNEFFNFWNVFPVRFDSTAR